MLKGAAILGVLAIVAAILGFTGIAKGFATVAIVLFFLFLAGAVVLFVLGYKAVKKVV